MGSASWKKCKFNFKTRFFCTIHVFKNYFVILFSVFSFQFSAIYNIQIDPKGVIGGR